MRSGVYKGKVIDNIDDENRGRLLAKVPALGFNWQKWAEPCVPFTQFRLPDVDTLVWIMFENGDENKPVWIGSMWKVGEMPAIVKGAVRKGDKTKGHKHTATFTLNAPNGPVTGTVTIDTVQDEMEGCSSKVKIED